MITWLVLHFEGKVATVSYGVGGRRDRYNAMRGGSFMKRRWRLPAAVLLALTLGGEVVAAEAPRWLKDWEQAKKAAGTSGKPIFVVFRCEH